MGPCPPISQIKLETSAKRGFPEAPIVVPPKAESADAIDLKTSTKELTKLEWTDRVVPEADSGSKRYDFDGNEITSAADYKPELHHHGDEPGRPGYTIEEIFHLAQSAFPSQKAIAIRTIGSIAQKASMKGRSVIRQFHRTLVGQWKSHIRLSVACSDTSINVRTAAWWSLLALTENLDKECGCVVSDLGSIPEFFRSFNPENEDSVKVFLYILNNMTDDEVEVVPEAMENSILGAAEKFNLEPERFVCGVGDVRSQIEKLSQSESSPAPEIIATLCDRVACLSVEPLIKEDVELFERILEDLRPSFPFFASGVVDEFAWANRCNMVATALTEFEGPNYVAVFLSRLCWLFTSSLFPLECRASVWSNTELVSNISRIIEVEGNNEVGILGNHAILDFACSDQEEVTRENAMVLRSLRASCMKFLDESSGQGSSQIISICNSLISKLGKI